LKCKNCGADISDEISKQISDTVISNLPKQKEVQVQEKVVKESPPEVQFTWCDSCHGYHKNPNFREPTKQCRDCDAMLDASRDKCVFCGSEDIKNEDDWW
jgi:hypothetical protein